MTLKRYERIASLARLAAERDVAGLARLAAQKRELEERLSELQAQRRSLLGANPAQQIAGLKWSIWLEQTEMRVRTRMYEIEKQMEHARALARRSFGKSRASEMLHDAARAEMRQTVRRRAEREGRPPD